MLLESLVNISGHSAQLRDRLLVGDQGAKVCHICCPAGEDEGVHLVPGGSLRDCEHHNLGTYDPRDL
ncbi:hypothetical protein WJX74_008992 [Apatococcus lobatus]|uniref:Uncharacterized protein n=1 Tax=Apatococcus lobatus TaxID=904363 RepID=A0AAW1QCE5_9CHLO